MRWLGYLLIVVASTLNAVQTGCNAELQKGLARPLLAAAVVYAVGLAGLLMALGVVGVISTGPSLPPLSQLSRVPWWGMAGGLLGATFIVAMVTTAERVGSAAFVALTFTSSILTAVLIDHFGWVGMRQHPAGLWRIIGCLLMAGGVALVARF